MGKAVHKGEHKRLCQNSTSNLSDVPIQPRSLFNALEGEVADPPVVMCCKRVSGLNLVVELGDYHLHRPSISLCVLLYETIESVQRMRFKSTCSVHA